MPGARASRFRVYGVIGLHIGNYPKIIWTLSQDFFLGYHAASRSPRKRTPAQGGGPIILARFLGIFRLNN